MNYFFLSFLFITSVSHAQSVEPGLWQADSTFEVNGLPLPPSQEKQCIDAKKARDIKQSILQELKKQGCTSTKWIVKGQKVEVSLKCRKSPLDAVGNLAGTIGKKTYDLHGEAKGTYSGIPAHASMSLKGKWLSSCKN